MGTLQVVLVLGMGKTVGGSSGYVTLVAQWVVSDKLKQKFQYLANAREGFVRNWWMVGRIRQHLTSSITLMIAYFIEFCCYSGGVQCRHHHRSSVFIHVIPDHRPGL